MLKNNTRFSAVYFFSGVNQGLRDKAIADIKERVLGGNITDFNYNLVYADTAPVESVIEICNTMPFASPIRLVILKRFERYSAKDKKILAEYCEDPSEFSVLVIANNEKPSKQNAWYKLLDKNSDSRVFWPYKEADIQRMLADVCRSKGKKIDINAAKAFAEIIGTNAIDIDAEINKIIIYCKDKNEITLADIKDMMAHGANHDIYGWAAKITAGRYKEALKLFNRFTAKEMKAPQLVLFALYDRYIKILRYITLLKEGAQAAAAQKSVGVFSFLDPTFHTSAVKHDFTKLKKIFDLLVNVDFCIKTGKGSASMLIENLVIDIARVNFVAKNC